MPISPTSHLLSTRLGFLTLLFLPCSLLLLPTSTSALESVSYRQLLDKVRHAAREHQPHPEEPPARTTPDQSHHDVQEHVFHQALDHFETDETTKKKKAVLPQRYFYTDRYVAAPAMRRANSRTTTTTTLAFLCVGGEGPALDKSVLVDSVHCTGDMLETARKLNQEGASVHVFALEHRYYGSSFPHILENTNAKNLRYLSSRQALADLANFVQHMNQKHHLGTAGRDVKWVTFGGSYPGMLSAWARLLYPHLVYASVSNSSPVQATVDFPQYQNHVAKEAYGNVEVGGSEECLQVVRQGHAQVADLLRQNDKRELSRLAELFDLCDGAKELENETNRDLWVGDGLFTFDVQSNDPSCEGDLCNIDKICTYLLQTKDKNPMKRVASLTKAINKLTSEENCTYANWNNDIQKGILFSIQTKQNRQMMSWTWQTCTEFGFYQTCEVGSDCPYGQGFHDVDQDLKICYDLFGIDKDRVYQSVQESLDFYGGWDLQGTRIMFVNGRVDPWSELSVTGNRGSQEQPALWVEGASHHFWTHRVKESDSAEVVAARKKIYEQVAEWLSEDGEVNVSLS